MKTFNSTKLYLYYFTSAIAIGAFGAHGIKGKISDSLFETFKTGSNYHLLVAVFMIAIVLYANTNKKDFSIPLSLMLLGNIIFSFNCYLYAITSIKFFAMIIPIGGVLMIVSPLLVSKRIE
jgi:uncharacterized membrane protein YgdD (TMEM256/DUF423 family)